MDRDSEEGIEVQYAEKQPAAFFETIASSYGRDEWFDLEHLVSRYQIFDSVAYEIASVKYLYVESAIFYWIYYIEPQGAHVVEAGYLAERDN